MKAICIRCGTTKIAPWKPCRKCGLTPVGTDLVKSVYCSVGRYANDPDRRVAYEKELLQMSAEIRAGRDIAFEETELKRLVAEQKAVAATSKAAWGAVLRFFFPAILCLGVLYLLIALLRK